MYRASGIGINLSLMPENEKLYASLPLKRAAIQYGSENVLCLALHAMS